MILLTRTFQAKQVSTGLLVVEWLVVLTAACFLVGFLLGWAGYSTMPGIPIVIALVTGPYGAALSKQMRKQ